MKAIIKLSSIIMLAIVLALLASVGLKKLRAQIFPLKTFRVWTHVKNTRGQSGDRYLARRSDGAIFTNSSSGRSTLRLIPEGITVLSTNQNGNITTLGTGAKKAMNDHKSDCSDSEYGGELISGDTKTILGFAVLHALNSSIDFDSSRVSREIKMSSWIAPALDCSPLEEVTTYYRGGQVDWVETATATKAILGDPPADTFKIPNGMEVPPSKFYADLGVIQKNPTDLQKQDDRYYKDKAARESR